MARGETRAKVDAYVAGKLAWEEQTPYSPPADAMERAKYKQGYEDAKARSERKD